MSSRIEKCEFHKDVDLINDCQQCGAPICCTTCCKEMDAVISEQYKRGAVAFGNTQPAIKKRVLVACEFSGRVREAFRKNGHDAWSCDLLDADDKSPYHIKGNVLDFLKDDWDVMIAHPPCTHLAVSGARWFKDKQAEQAEALDFVAKLFAAPIQCIALENPVSIISTRFRKPDQIIQPWMFGHGDTKATCLWLKNLPKLQPTNIVEGRNPAVWKLPPSPDRWKLRSITYQGIADAMGDQWGRIVCIPDRFWYNHP